MIGEPPPHPEPAFQLSIAILEYASLKSEITSPEFLTGGVGAASAGAAVTTKLAVTLPAIYDPDAS